jgi:hypothetical protein
MITSSYLLSKYTQNLTKTRDFRTAIAYHQSAEVTHYYCIVAVKINARYNMITHADGSVTWFMLDAPLDYLSAFACHAVTLV